MSYYYHLVPELIQDRRLFQLEKETQLPLRLSLLGLAYCADKAGRFQWRPAELKQQALPYDNGIDFDRVMHLLRQQGFLVIHQYKQVSYGLIALPFKKTRQKTSSLIT